MESAGIHVTISYQVCITSMMATAASVGLKVIYLGDFIQFRYDYDYFKKTTKDLFL